MNNERTSMEKRFEIKVTEIGQEVRTIGKRWERGGPTKSDPDSQYGYTPETEATCDYEREVFRQIVNELDLSALISTVNKITPT